MEVKLEPGKYILAVSGGVDSMVLLDLLSRQKNISLVLAHFDHGIRPQSGQDYQLVADAAKSYGLAIVKGSRNLGKNASEEKARDARYEFLEKVRADHAADKIVTAHHQDDLIETAVINILRGTGRRGLVSIAKNKKIIRPLLAVPKSQIINYAVENKIKWNEDSSNCDTRYLRNYVRHNVIPKLGTEGRQAMLDNIEDIAKNYEKLNRLLEVLDDNVRAGKVVDRAKFISLPDEISRELMTLWLRRFSSGRYDKKSISRLVVAIKTAKSGSRHDINSQQYLKLNLQTAVFHV